MTDQGEFRGSTVLITGASKGIGAETAALFGEAGAFVLVHYNTAKEEAAAVLNRVRELGGNGETVPGDLRTVTGCRELIDRLKQNGWDIDILVNNAGSLIKRTPVLEMSWELWDQVLTLNLTSAYFLSQAVLPGMVEKKRGVIVNVGSIAGRNGGGIGASAYSIAKAAISTMTRSLAKEFSPHGIRVNCVSPGTIDTNYHRTFSTPQMLEAIAAATPMGRHGTAREVAEVIIFLCSCRSNFIQGQTIEVNGGFLMP
ncbi:MAG TPA: SDR family NAD(P)-dependent oxidoreductase [Acidobacteriota bacterium]|nr:SDR family NAD(P)-dependent oxidoreductase [Acidobacteriota bacterium]